MSRHRVSRAAGPIVREVILVVQVPVKCCRPAERRGVRGGRNVRREDAAEDDLGPGGGGVAGAREAGAGAGALGGDVKVEKETGHAADGDTGCSVNGSSSSPEG